MDIYTLLKIVVFDLCIEQDFSLETSWVAMCITEVGHIKYFWRNTLAENNEDLWFTEDF